MGVEEDYASRNILSKIENYGIEGGIQTILTDS